MREEPEGAHPVVRGDYDHFVTPRKGFTIVDAELNPVPKHVRATEDPEEHR